MKSLFLISVVFFTIVLEASAQEYIVTPKSEKGFVGLQNKNGAELLPQNYLNIYTCINSKAHVVTQNKKEEFILLDLKTKVSVKLFGDHDLLKLYDQCELTRKDQIRYIVDGKMGIKYFLGGYIFPAEYDEITPVAKAENLYILKKDKLYQLINPISGMKTGWFNLYDKPYRIFNYDNNLSYLNEPFFAKLYDKLVCITPGGKVWTIEKPKDMPFKVSDYWSDSDPVLVKQNGKYGYLGNKGVLTIAAQYEAAEQFVKYQAKVTKNGKSFIIDEQGNLIED